MSKFVVALIVTILSGCASVPLGTMLEFRSFTKDDFINLQPQNLRARVHIDEPARADIEKAELALELNTEKGLRIFNFPLELIDELKIEPVSGLFSRSPGKTEYTLKLSEEAIDNFRATQQIIRNEQSGRLSFSVKTGFEQLPSDITEIRLSIFLKLSEDKGFVTLINNAKLEIKHDG
ncbi:hypothetical protein QWY20_12885 [Alkalimonas sp. MEB108]|uniref:Lipoprotein n=1 Tax=Alkalimonas cellulosilytica TaxID=3058395 RepID=A0ABU7J757_9GAMM|nr:hypothetical protein [Alkalimonas sp. MEB108]MEE2002351.1 hypothetical protein [Alkalimonas sp. MEB108]